MKKWVKIISIALACLLLIAGVGFLLYVSNYYKADDIALAVMENPTIRTESNFTILSPSVPGETGLIFYPGGKVEHSAYLPLLEQLRQQGVTCVLVEMPFHLAVFNPNAADSVLNALPDIQHWYIGGHSLGGAMASSYASQHPDAVEGLVLLGAYLYGDFPVARALTIYGSEDMVLDKSKITYTENVVEIAGGNHAQFGNYGAQKGDGTPSITAEQQQGQTVAAIVKFIKRKEAS